MDESTLIAIATARAFQQGSHAQRVVVILDRPGEEPLMIEVDEFLDAEVTEGEHVATLPHNAGLDTPPKPLPELRPTPPSAIAIDLETGELAAPIGTIDHLKDAVLALAGAFGGLHGRERRVRHQRSRDPDHARRPRGRTRRPRRRGRPVRAVIRPETPADYEWIRALHTEAFAPSPLEAQIVDDLRAAGDHVPELCLVHAHGHVMISRGRVDDHPGARARPDRRHPHPPTPRHRR